MWFWLGWTVMIAANLLDLVSTVPGLKAGKPDLNPLINFVWSKLGVFGLVLLKVVYIGGLALLYNLYIKQPPALDPEWIGKTLVGASGLFWFAGIHNLVVNSRKPVA